MDLCIWFENGNFAYFTDVKEPIIRTDTIEFEYFGRESKKNKRAKFNAEKIAGYSFSDDES